MSKVLEIDGKKYTPSSALAGSFGYSADYISKLARDGKILGQQVGRQWYIESDSLADFSRVTKSQKAERREELRVARKLEWATNENKLNNSVVIPTQGQTLSKAVVVFACLLCLSSLAWAVNYNNLAIADIQEGAKLFAEDITEILPDSKMVTDSQVALLGWLKEWWWGKEEANNLAKSDINGIESVNKNNQNGIVLLESEVGSDEIDSIRQQFSDPVEVQFTESDSGLIKPIFKNATEESYKFLLVPVTKQEQ